MLARVVHASQILKVTLRVAAGNAVRAFPMSNPSASYSNWTPSLTEPFVTLTSKLKFEEK